MLTEGETSGVLSLIFGVVGAVGTAPAIDQFMSKMAWYYQWFVVIII